MMKKAIILFSIILLSCKGEPIKTYTLKVFFNDGSTDTLKIDHGYRIDENGNLGKQGYGKFHNVATGVKYVKELSHE